MEIPGKVKSALLEVKSKLAVAETDKWKDCLKGRFIQIILPRKTGHMKHLKISLLLVLKVI